MYIFKRVKECFMKKLKNKNEWEGGWEEVTASPVQKKSRQMSRGERDDFGGHGEDGDGVEVSVF